MDRSSNSPFTDPTPTHFRENNSDKKIKYHFEGFTPSHSQPYMNEINGFRTKSDIEVPPRYI
jgi:hypothetical protein